MPCCCNTCRIGFGIVFFFFKTVLFLFYSEGFLKTWWNVDSSEHSTLFHFASLRLIESSVVDIWLYALAESYKFAFVDAATICVYWWYFSAIPQNPGVRDGSWNWKHVLVYSNTRQINPKQYSKAKYKTQAWVNQSMNHDIHLLPVNLFTCGIFQTGILKDYTPYLVFCGHCPTTFWQCAAGIKYRMIIYSCGQKFWEWPKC